MKEVTGKRQDGEEQDGEMTRAWIKVGHREGEKGEIGLVQP